ncbi:hypothetical protein SLEP1_g26071 [Rubroshorea leprosula]|uniref:Uncharacterized protein n=1 Tax=Rubroshorea leprosula TaxID=152421 RepID=A0AAV5JL29_9ROSI|nr:hypothetical protein SLEP1_g26071 [Rubroshorea leprosula]
MLSSSKDLAQGLHNSLLSNFHEATRGGVCIFAAHARAGCSLCSTSFSSTSGRMLVACYYQAPTRLLGATGRCYLPSTNGEPEAAGSSEQYSMSEVKNLGPILTMRLLASQSSMRVLGSGLIVILKGGVWANHHHILLIALVFFNKLHYKFARCMPSSWETALLLPSWATLLLLSWTALLLSSWSTALSFATAELDYFVAAEL